MLTITGRGDSSRVTTRLKNRRDWRDEDDDDESDDDDDSDYDEDGSSYSGSDSEDDESWGELKFLFDGVSHGAK